MVSLRLVDKIRNEISDDVGIRVFFYLSLFYDLLLFVLYYLSFSISGTIIYLFFIHH